MARSDLLIDLVQAATAGDKRRFQKTVEAVIAEERRKQHHVLAEQLAEALNGSGASDENGPTRLSGKTAQLLHEIVPDRGLCDLVLPSSVRDAVKELREEHARRDLLRSYGVEPRHRVLLVGPPGNGKTSLGEAIAHELHVPLLLVRYEGVVGSFLGETASRLRRVFDHARTRHCVLFFDEFDAVGKERGDVHETGEIKRVVSSLLVQIDEMPSHVVVVTATNHPELLDRAVWRRFQLRLELPRPTRSAVEEWFSRFADSVEISLGYSARTLADKLHGLSFGELEEFGLSLIRRSILSESDDPRTVARRQIEQWKAFVGPSSNEGD